MVEVAVINQDAAFNSNRPKITDELKKAGSKERIVSVVMDHDNTIVDVICQIDED